VQVGLQMNVQVQTGLLIHTSKWQIYLVLFFINSSFPIYLLVSYVTQVEVQVGLQMKVQVQVEEVVEDH
jgi:hypothetical protein